MLKNKNAVITGASRGIGREIALKMAQNGANIAVIYSGNTEHAEKVCRDAEEFGIKAKCYQCNAADFNAVKSVCDRIVTDFGGVDILVNNAGITRDNLMLRMTEAEFDEVVSVNLKGAFNFAKHLCRHLLKSTGGRVINIASVSGIMGNPGQANYSAAKAGMIGLTKTLAKELASKNITCNAIAPGFIETDMTAALKPPVIEAALSAIPLKRMGKPEEVAALAVFLASPYGAYITGEVIKIDGGLCI